MFRPQAFSMPLRPNPLSTLVLCLALLLSVFYIILLLSQVNNSDTRCLYGILLFAKHSD